MSESADAPVVGVGAVVIEDGRILMVERDRDPGKGLWAIPGGKLRRGERLVDAAAREVAEETGLTVDVADLVWSGEIITDSHHLVILDFAATVTGGELRAGDDARSVAWVELDRVRDLPLTGTMLDLLDTLGR